MGLYLMLSNLTDKGRQRVKSHPERIKEVNEEVESRGFKIVAQYAFLGNTISQRSSMFLTTGTWRGWPWI